MGFPDIYLAVNLPCRSVVHSEIQRFKIDLMAPKDDA